MVIDAFFKANTEWINRAGQRWAAAAKEIDKGTYEPKNFISDLFRSAVKDPLQWYEDVTRESQAGGRVLKIPVGDTQGDSGHLHVPNPGDTKVTSLVRLGGTQVMEEGAGKNVNVVKPPNTSGVVLVDIRNLDRDLHPAGVYVGFLYEDKLVVSQIVVLRT